MIIFPVPNLNLNHNRLSPGAAFDLFRLMGDAESEKYHLYARPPNSSVGRPNFVLISILSPARALKFTSGNRPWWWRGRKSLRLPTCAREAAKTIYMPVGRPPKIKRTCTPRYCARKIKASGWIRTRRMQITPNPIISL